MPYVRYLLILAGLTACASREVDTFRSFRIYEEDGVTIAETTGGPKYTGELFEYTKVLELRQDPDIPESLLNSPSPTYHIDERGRFHIADMGDLRVVVFGPDGRYLFCYGGEGNGPGEFRSLHIISIRNGLVTIYDLRTYRSTVFTTDGELVEIVSPPTGLGGLSAMVKVSDQVVACAYSRMRTDDDYAYDMQGIITLNTDGHTLAHIQSAYIPTFYSYSVGSRNIHSAFSYLARPVVTYTPQHGILRSIGTEPIIELFDIYGVITKRIVLDLPREEVTRQDKDSAKENVRRRTEFDFLALPAEAVDQEIENMQFPKWKSYWESVYVDENGYFWLRNWTSTTSLFRTGGHRYRALSPDGEYLGDTRWPGIDGTIAGNKLLTWIINLQTGEGTPVIYQMVPVPEGFTYP